MRISWAFRARQDHTLNACSVSQGSLGLAYPTQSLMSRWNTERLLCLLPLDGLFPFVSCLCDSLTRRS